MSTKAPSDDAWATMLALVAELQAKVATLESKATNTENRLNTLEEEPGLDEFMLEFKSIHEELRDVVRYIARRDDIPESRVN